MVSVDHGGKLFERVNTNEPAGCDNRDRNNSNPAFHFSQRVFAHATETIGFRELFASQGWVLLLLFLPTKKSKRKKAD
jgi:hypothetical protein